MNLAYNEGRKAYNEGKSIKANPYPDMTSERLEWAIGYRTAKATDANSPAVPLRRAESGKIGKPESHSRANFARELAYLVLYLGAAWLAARPSLTSGELIVILFRQPVVVFAASAIIMATITP